MFLLHIVAFGFCDYGDPEASLRAIRLLHTKVLGDKALVVSKLLASSYNCSDSHMYRCMYFGLATLFNPCVNSREYSMFTLYRVVKIKWQLVHFTCYPKYFFFEIKLLSWGPEAVGQNEIGLSVFLVLFKRKRWRKMCKVTYNGDL